MSNWITEDGKLVDNIRPAVYFDSSVLIDYWMVRGVEISDLAEKTMSERVMDSPVDAFIRSLLNAEKRLSKVKEIRKRLAFGDSNITAVTTGLALWEFKEWYAEANFKQLVSRAAGPTFLYRKGKKEIGDFLKEIYELWVQEGEEEGHFVPGQGSSVLEMMMYYTWMDLDFVRLDDLEGVLVLEVRRFNWPPTSSPERFANPSILAYLQLGTADIMHVLFANHLGCEYFASFDSDFKRAKPYIERTGMKVLTSPDEILKIL